MSKTIKRMIAAALCLSLLLGTLSACTGKEAGKYEADTRSRKEDGLKQDNALYKEYPDKHINNIPDDLPDAIRVEIDRGGDLSVGEITDSAKIRQFVSLFTKVRVGSRTDVSISDNYNQIVFIWADGTESHIFLQKTTLEVQGDEGEELYELENFAALWNFAQEIAGEGAQKSADTTEEADNGTEAEPTEESTGELTETETETETESTSEDPQKNADFRVVPSDNANVEYEYYDNGLFTAYIPKGWVVEVCTYSDYVHYTFTIFNPDNPNYRIFFNMKTEGYLSSEDEYNFYKSNYPKTELAGWIDPQTTAGFYRTFSKVFRNFNSEYFTAPEIADFNLIASFGVDAAGGEMVRAACINEKGEKVDGIYYCNIVPVSLYYVTGLIVYSTVFMTAPDGELPNWIGVLDKVMGSVEFTDTFKAEYKKEVEFQGAVMQEISQICSDITDIVISVWENQQAAYDRESQKRRDAEMGYVRVVDTETGEVYEAPEDFFDRYEGDRYDYCTDDMYSQPISGFLVWE